MGTALTYSLLCVLCCDHSQLRWSHVWPRSLFEQTLLSLYHDPLVFEHSSWQNLVKTLHFFKNFIIVGLSLLSLIVFSAVLFRFAIFIS